MLAAWQTGFLAVKIAVQSLWEQLRLGGNLIKSVLTFDVEGIKSAITNWGNNMTGKVADNAKKLGNVWKNAWNNTIDGKLSTGKQFSDDPFSQPTGVASTGQGNNFSGEGTGEPGKEGTPGEFGREGTPGEMESLGDPRIAKEEIYTDAVLEQSKLRDQIFENEQKIAEQRAANEEQLQQQKRDAYLSTLDTIINVFGQESAIGKAALLAKQAYAIAETIINIAKGAGESAAAAPFPANIPLIVGFVAQVAGLVSTIKGATNIKKKAAGGFSTETPGGYTPGPRMYIAGEAGTEWIAPNWMIKDKETAPIISMLEIQRRKPQMKFNIPQLQEGGYTSIGKKMADLKGKGIGIEEKQNANLKELFSLIGDSLDKNTAALKNLKDAKENPPSIAIQSFERERNKYVKMMQNSGL